MCSHMTAYVCVVPFLSTASVTGGASLGLHKLRFWAEAQGCNHSRPMVLSWRQSRERLSGPWRGRG